MDAGKEGFFSTSSVDFGPFKAMKLASGVLGPYADGGRKKEGPGENGPPSQPQNKHRHGGNLLLGELAAAWKEKVGFWGPARGILHRKRGDLGRPLEPANPVEGTGGPGPARREKGPPSPPKTRGFPKPANPYPLPGPEFFHGRETHGPTQGPPTQWGTSQTWIRASGRCPGRGKGREGSGARRHTDLLWGRPPTKKTNSGLLIGAETGAPGGPRGPPESFEGLGPPRGNLGRWRPGSGSPVFSWRGTKPGNFPFGGSNLFA